MRGLLGAVPHQQLVNQAGGALCGSGNVLQGFLGGNIALKACFRMQLQHGQRCTHLVRGIGHKALLLLARQPDAGNQAIESLHHGLHFPWGLLLGQRGDVIGLALL